jgi:hypothetical protein
LIFGLLFCGAILSVPLTRGWSMEPKPERNRIINDVHFISTDESSSENVDLITSNGPTKMLMIGR